jgi:hypothetical protein
MNIHEDNWKKWAWCKDLELEKMGMTTKIGLQNANGPHSQVPTDDGETYQSQTLLVVLDC